MYIDPSFTIFYIGFLTESNIGFMEFAKDNFACVGWWVLV
jgi:hypothetical protein